MVKVYSFLSPWIRNGCICDSTTVQLLFEVSQGLYDAIDFVNIKDDDNRQTSHLISRFVEMVPKLHLPLSTFSFVLSLLILT